MLQWSHAQPNVETARRTFQSPVRGGGFNGATLSRTWKLTLNGERVSGVQRLQWSHAQPNVETLLDEGLITEDQVLQWSHAQPNVETEWVEDAITAAQKLQWSHAQPNVETRASQNLYTTRPLCLASMEPRSAERGNS